MKVSYQWLGAYLGAALPPVEEVAEFLTKHAFEIDGVDAVGDDFVIDVDVLPNRSSDCLSHRGIARELASILGVSLAVDPLAPQSQSSVPPTDTIQVTIADAEACPRFAVVLMTGVTVGPSPAWLQARLATIGQRSINNIVDATNYVMYALGQPLHAYDADLFTKQDGQWHFGVRFARPQETIALLPEGGNAATDRIVELTGSELLITDHTTDTPIGLAGVKGGRYAGVHEGTTAILIEAAHFHPTITRRTARRLGIVIDASKRFENEPSRELPQYALADIATLITQIAGGTCVGVHDSYVVPQTTPTVSVRVARIQQLLGLQIASAEIERILTRIGATWERAADGVGTVYQVTAPFERLDLQIEADYVEEVARLYGLDKIVTALPTEAAAPPVTVSAYQAYSEQIRNWLVERGFSEVITSSFRANDTIELQNALASDKRFVRSNLATQLTQVLTSNYPQRDVLGLEAVRVFEIGTVFTKTSTDVAEHVALALGVRHKGTGPTKADNEQLQAIIEQLTAEIGGQAEWCLADGVAECNLSAWLAALPVPERYRPVPARALTVYQAPSPYPAIARDIALWVPASLAAAAVEAELLPAAGPLCVRSTLFDTFTKAERTSYAFRLVFQSPERTLTDDEVNDVMEQVYHAATAAGWEVR